MKSKALIIREFDGITYDGGYELLEFVGLAKPYPLNGYPASAIEFLHFLINKTVDPTISEEKQRQAKIAIKDLIIFKPAVREYIMLNAQQNTASQVILYQEYCPEQILEKLDQLDDKEHFEVLYIGGGHGSRDIQLSGLKTSQIELITKKLNEKDILASSIVLGSCYSAAFADNFLPFLAEDGVMISDTTACVNDHFSETLIFLKEEQDDFLRPAPKMSMDEFAKIAATEILELSGDKLGAAEFANLSKRLLEFPNIAQAQRNEIKILIQDYKVLDEGINRRLGSVYLTDGTENHVQNLHTLLQGVNYQQRQAIYGQNALAEFIQDQYLTNTDPQSHLFLRLVDKLINLYEMNTIEELEESLSSFSITQVLDMGESINPIPQAQNIDALTKSILTELTQKAREANGICVTGKAITNDQSLFVTILDKNTTGTPPGAHIDDIKENNIIVKNLCQKRDIKETPIGRELIDSNTSISSNLSKINSNTQRECFNKLFSEAIQSSLRNRAETEEDLKMAMALSMQLQPELDAEVNESHPTASEEDEDTEGEREFKNGPGSLIQTQTQSGTSRPERIITPIGTLVKDLISSSPLTDSQRQRQQVEREVLTESRAQDQTKTEPVRPEGHEIACLT